MLITQPTFCFICVDTGQYTGATCQQSGPCGCFYTQNTCHVTAEAPAETDPLLAPESTQCTDGSAVIAPAVVS